MRFGRLFGLQIWLQYIGLCMPHVTLMLCTVFLPKLYLRFSHPILCISMPAITACFCAYGNYKAPHQPTDIGWYGSVVVQLYILFGGYMVWPYAIPSSIMSLAVTYTWIVYGPRAPKAQPRWDVFELNILVMSCGPCSIPRTSLSFASRSVLVAHS